MPFACIFVPDLPVEALLRTEPELRSRPLVVLEGKAPLQKVFAANEAARRTGVTPGMTKLQVEACGGLVIRARSELQESAAHAALLDCAQSFSPRVEDVALDTLILDLAGTESLLGSVPRIVRGLARRASDFGLTTNVAAASNPDAAMLAAHGFCGATVIPEGKEAEKLGGLPVDILFTAQNCQGAKQFLEIFQRWGIRNLHDLAALPNVALSERLGQQGVYWQKLARGATSRTLVPVEPPLIFEEAIELEYPLMLLEPLAFLLGRLLDQLCTRLEARALATQELRLSLDLENGAHGEEVYWNEVGAGTPTRPGRQRFQRILRLPVPLLDPKTFLKLLQLDLKAHPPGAPIVKIHLMAEPVRLRAAQNGLFLPPSPEPEKLELTLARIAGIVGEEKVGSLEILDTHRPEGFRMQRFVPNNPFSPQRHGGTEKNNPHSSVQMFFMNPSEPQCLRGEFTNSSSDLVTALRIFRPPVAATITMRNGKPAGISCSKHKEMGGEVLWAAGPWRASGDWWEQEGWARDEWDVAVQGEAGIALHRLVRDLLSGRWLVEGTYD